MKIIKLEEYERKDLFLNYDKNTNPFSFITIKLDITNVYEYCKENKHIYATLGYLIGKTANEVEAYKYRKENDNIIYYDTLNVNYTQKKDDGNIGFYTVSFKDSIKEFIKDYDAVYNNWKINERKVSDFTHDEVWVSCEPWFSATSLIPPFDKNVTIPQFIWDKFIFENNRVYTNLMLMSHHGFVDGSHIGEFIEKLNKNIERLR